MRKKEKYLNLVNRMSRNYRCVRFVNLSISSLGVFFDECSTFLDMMNDIGIDKKQQRYIIKKMINIAIRATYYIFCCRNRNWDSPDLMQFWFLFFFFFLFFVCFVFVLFCFLFFFNNPISSSICTLPIRSEIYNCAFKNTNKVSIIIIKLLVLLFLTIMLHFYANYVSFQWGSFHGKTNFSLDLNSLRVEVSFWHGFTHLQIRSCGLSVV